VTAGDAPTPPLPRDQFPVSGRYRYFDHAGVCPLPRVAVEAGHAFLDDALHNGAVGYDAWDARIEEIRSSAAGLMGVPATDVAFVKNTTEGLSFVAAGLDWRPGDRVLAPGHEFPSSVYPWLALRDRGVTVELIEPVGRGMRYPLDAVADALAAAPTRLVAVSWVNFARGGRVDLAALARLCHDHGALLCVDVIQGLGLIPAELAAWGVDFAAADGHKWMLGPQGAGVLYVAGHARDLVRPVEPGWASVAHRDDYDRLELVYDRSARRFEGGTYAVEAILQMGASIDLLRRAGVPRVWAHVQGLLDHLAAGLAAVGATVLSDLDPAGRSGVLTFSLPGHEPAGVRDRLRAAAIICKARGGGIRVAPHGYNTTGELDALVEVVGDLASRIGGA
jgi:selenocysteine lyase/cysteine desulfurase